jgi:DNA-binding phage protein
MGVMRQLSQAVLKSGQSRNQIAQQTGVDPTILHRIVKGTGGCTVETLDKLCDYLGLELMPRKSSKR